MNVTIGQRLRALRLRTGLTLDEAGRHIGASKQTLYKYETGIITNIPLDKIGALAALYRVPPAEIMGWRDGAAGYYHDPDMAALADMIKDNPRYRILFEASRNLKAEDVDFVIDMINKLAKTDDAFNE